MRLSFSRPFAALCVFSCSAATAARADDFWTATISVNPGMSSAYPGSKSIAPFLAPGGGLRRAGTPESFSAPDDNPGLALYDTGWLKAGPVGRFQGARRSGDHPELRGIKDVDWTVEGGVFAELWPTEKLRSRIEIRHGLHGHFGFVGTLGLDWVEKAGAWTLSAGPRLELADRQYAKRYFSVWPSEALANGQIAPFAAGGGIRSIGFAGAAKYHWNQQWSTTLYARYDRLMGDAAASPITARLGSRNQFSFGAIISYSFDFKQFW
jgi:outer membrane protein